MYCNSVQNCTKNALICYICLGVEVKFKHLSYPVLIHPILIKEMRTVEEYAGMLNVGASVTLVELEKALKEQINKKPGNNLKYIRLVEYLYNL